ncbi:lytic transglycosylase domain-containing protein [Rhodopila sp.]|uniref:lytic transglycosylase domain-containing protein n=1 Tax=Rhodopila sp. TaxID=2480087 RepID=UPI003D106A21
MTEPDQVVIFRGVGGRRNALAAATCRAGAGRSVTFDLGKLVTPWRLRAAGTVAVLTALAACGTVPHQDAVRESARYVAHARHNYTAPGPAEDPWGPYIREAAARFDIPEIWIRSLMRVESGGNEYRNGDLITSGAGAMGLMQVMPETYDELRNRYNLSDDPFNPHDNIIAGVAYMREMYDIYGSPGFLAAYNAGPARLDDYLANVRPLPDETRHYVAMIGPNLRGIYPNSRSAADQMAMNTLPINIPPGKRYSRPVMLARAKPGRGGRVPRRLPVEVAQLPEAPRHGMPAPQRYALVSTPPIPPAPPRGGFRLIASANAADAAPVRHGPAAPGPWAIQVGAFANQGQAHGALAAAQHHAHVELAVAHPFVTSVHQGRTVLWRARMTGMSRETAIGACQKITHGRSSCIVLSPESQS